MRCRNLLIQDTWLQKEDTNPQEVTLLAHIKGRFDGLYILKLGMSTGKAEYGHITGLLQTFPILEWKGEVISLDFITGFPLTKKQHNSIMVVVVE